MSLNHWAFKSIFQLCAKTDALLSSLSRIFWICPGIEPCFSLVRSMQSWRRCQGLILRLIVFEQSLLHFYFSLGPTNYITCLDHQSKLLVEWWIKPVFSLLCRENCSCCLLSIHSFLFLLCHSIPLILQQLDSVLETAFLVSPLRDNGFSATLSMRKGSLPLPGTLGNWLGSVIHQK